METQMRDTNNLEAAKGRIAVTTATALCDVKDTLTGLIEANRTLHLAWARNGLDSISLYCNAVTDSCVGVRHLYNGAVITNIRGMTAADTTALTSSGDSVDSTGATHTGLGITPDMAIPVLEAGADVGAGQCLAQLQQLGAGYTINTDTTLATNATGGKAGAHTSTVANIQLSHQAAVTEVLIGAEVGVVFINKSLSDPALVNSLENLTTDQLRNIFYGIARDWNTIDGSGIGLLNNSTVASLPLIAVHREPPSGTYNTFEQTMMASGGGSQEMLKTSAGDSGRVFGSGDMIKAVAHNAGAIGYTFYSPSAFATDGGNVKYLKINGVDPLGQSSYSGDLTGITPDFSRVKNGSYPIWSFPRVIFPKTADQLTATEQSWLNTLRQTPGTFVPFSDMKVLRSHRQDAFGAPSNGTAPGAPAQGNDIGGLVLNIGDDARIGGAGVIGLRE
jgi:ABC-type phosphate transport system substrate-binding protein